MTIWLWWHDSTDMECPWAQSRAYLDPQRMAPMACTCVDEFVRPIPGRWRVFQEVSPLPKEEGFECL